MKISKTNSPYKEQDCNPAAKSNYDYKADVKTVEIKDLKTSRDSVPTWSTSDMNEAKIKNK